MYATIILVMAFDRTALQQLRRKYIFISGAANMKNRNSSGAIFPCCIDHLLRRLLSCLFHAVSASIVPTPFYETLSVAAAMSCFTPNRTYPVVNKSI